MSKNEPRLVQPQVLDITVLMGGPSNERQVSLQSGRAVAEALRRCGHTVTTADISPADASALAREGVDLVFIALHGQFGEDGQVQRLCERHGLRYVGSGPVASQQAMDKVASKKVFRGAGLLTPDWVVLERGTSSRRRARLLGQIPSPCVVKPVDGGSSVGVTIATDAHARDQALDALLAEYGRALVETFVRGREMTVGILGVQALPVIEIRPARPFYDYFAKYQDDATQYVVNPPMPADVDRQLRAAAVTAHRALACRDMSRADFILTDDGLPYVLEINTIPGFTSHSLLPKAAAAMGLSFEQLCDRIVRLAMKRVR